MSEQLFVRSSCRRARALTAGGRGLRACLLACALAACDDELSVRHLENVGEACLVLDRSDGGPAGDPLVMVVLDPCALPKPNFDASCMAEVIDGVIVVTAQADVYGEAEATGPLPALCGTVSTRCELGPIATSGTIALEYAGERVEEMLPVMRRFCDAD